MTNANRPRSAEETLHNHQENGGTGDQRHAPETIAIDDFTMSVIDEHYNARSDTDNGGTTPSPTSPQPSNTATNVHYRKMPQKSASQLDLSHKHINGIRPLNIVRTSSYAPSLGGQSHRSSEQHEHLHPPPSSEHDKSKHTRRHFATVFAISYAIFLVIFGTVVFIGNELPGLEEMYEMTVYPVAESFVIFMVSLSFLYFIALYVDIRLHVRKAKQTIRERERRQRLFEERVASGELDAQPAGMEALPSSSANASGVAHVSDEVIGQQLRLAPLPPVSHKYCFMTGRHGEFFYLKFGASWFALGLLIHAILQIAYQIIFLTTRDQEFCASHITLAMDILFPAYSLFVLFFIFKYMNVIINEYRGLARLMLMHALGTSVTMWIYTIVTETANAIRIARDIEEDTGVQHVCTRPDVLNFIHRNISPYLYPFIIEFCILIVGIFYMMWANISHCPRKYSAMGHHGHDAEVGLESGGDVVGNAVEDRQEVQHGAANGQLAQSVVMSEDHCGGTTAEHDGQYKSHLVMYADCHASNRGLFAGLVLIVVTIVFIILFFIATSDDEYLYIGILVNDIFELTVLVILLVAVALAYVQTAKLDINMHPMSRLDDMLLFIAVPAFFLESVFSMVPAVMNASWLNISIVVAQLAQILLQTPFIIDGLRRCSNAAHLRRTKPGRELITFLTIANVSLWLFYTFSVKTNYTGDERYKFYGYIVWNILNHISLPLIMFYRFHASVCLVDMWRHSYEPQPAGH